jgi:hypothetical protein
VKVSTRTLAAGTFLLLAAPVFAQTSGTSHPETLNDNIDVTVQQKPVAPVVTPEPQVYEAQPAPIRRQLPLTPDQTAEVVHPALHATAPENDPDAGIVTTYPYAANALPESTILRARLVGDISTITTRQGSHFIAMLSKNVEHDGKVILPMGASLEGRVTEIRSGRRISGGAAIHLQPETVTLPDGTLYHLNGQIIDVDSGHSARVNSEGTIVGGNHTARTAATFGLATGTGLVAGAALGGGVGAAVGAGVGAGAATIIWLKEDRQQTLPDGTELVFTLNSPMDLTPGSVKR